MDVRLSPELIREIEEILSSGKTAQLAVRQTHITLWSVSSKRKYEEQLTVTRR